MRKNSRRTYLAGPPPSRCAGAVPAATGKIHTDSVGKIITILIYLNPKWDDSGGRLRLLRAKDIDAVAAEVVPSGGNLVAFLRSDHSWHGHLPFSGERRVIAVQLGGEQAQSEDRGAAAPSLRIGQASAAHGKASNGQRKVSGWSNSRPNRLLAVRLSSLGDLVHTLPVVPALRAASPTRNSTGWSIRDGRRS